MRDTVRAVALVIGVAAAGAAAALAVGAVQGMSTGDLGQLLPLLAVSTVATVGAGLGAKAALVRTSLRHRLLAVALLGTGVALANLFVLSWLMLVSDHDAAVMTVLVVFAAGTGVALALVLAKGSMRAVDRLVEGARAIGTGRLDNSIGELDAGPELDTLAHALDHAAEQLGLARDRELRTEQMRRDLITAVSHDLRTPLASLRAMVEALDEGVIEDAPTVRRYVGEMRRSVDQLVSMVDDLFELTQLDAKAIDEETTRARLDDVVRSALASVEPAAGLKGLEIVSDLEGAAGATCSPRLVRVLQNLLVNAVRHTPPDGTVRIEAVRNEGGLMVAVEDTGEGIAPEDLPHVFEPLFRGDPARQGAGAGLGLALAQRIVEAMGGSIAAESLPTAGARFAIELPRS